MDLLCRRTAALTGDGLAADPTILPTVVEALNLLPGWYEDWVCQERERIRVLMLAAVDAIALGLRRTGRSAEAIDAALVAVTADPLRDTSQAVLISAHLSEGNLGEARRAFAAYRAVLREEFGIEPPEQLARAVGLTLSSPVRSTRARTADRRLPGPPTAPGPTRTVLPTPTQPRPASWRVSLRS